MVEAIAWNKPQIALFAPRPRKILNRPAAGSVRTFKIRRPTGEKTPLRRNVAGPEYLTQTQFCLDNYVAQPPFQPEALLAFANMGSAAELHAEKVFEQLSAYSPNVPRSYVYQRPHISPSPWSPSFGKNGKFAPGAPEI